MQNIFIDVLPPWVETGLQPAFYDLESGTVLQQTARMYAKVRELGEAFNTFTENVTNEVNTFENSVNATVEDYIERFNQLHDYVHDYFDNLDVQEEINNKLDKMLEDGVLQEIVEAYVQPHITWTYDNIADMQDSPSLVDGCYAKTYGYYSYGDGGGAEYQIVDTEPSGGFYVALDNGNYAKLVIKDKTIYTMQTGAKGDGITDDTSYIQAIFDMIESDYKDGFTVVVNGYHFVQAGLTLNGASGDYLKNIVITGRYAVRDYASMDNIKDGFIFDTTGCFDIADFNNIYGVKFEYTRGLVVKDLKFTTNETVENGEIPLNNIVGIRIRLSSSNELRNCNITKFYIGYYTGGAGLSYIKGNNFSLCNVGIRSAQAGDSTIEDNYINTMGWNIYSLSGTLKSVYSSMRSAGLVFGFGIWFGDGGNITVRGGKIEWVNVGIWQDYTTNMIYDTIHFDRCSVSGIAFTGHNRPTSKASVTNCIFTGCGGILPDPTESHIGGIGRSAIGAKEISNLLISNNRFTSDNGELVGSFKVSDVYYGPRAVLYFDHVYASSFVNNEVLVDFEYAHQLNYCEVLMDNNKQNVNYYINPHTYVYRQAGVRREIFYDTPSNMTDGNFDAGDMVYKPIDLTTRWKVTTAGSKQTINATVSVVTVGTEAYPGDGTVIDLGTSLPAGVRVGAYVNIAGVTGTKKIRDLLFSSKYGNHYFAKLNTACDVAVLNATMTNQSPAFTALT